jgi:hypothetical protein
MERRNPDAERLCRIEKDETTAIVNSLFNVPVPLPVCVPGLLSLFKKKKGKEIRARTRARARARLRRLETFEGL